jgi:hypothetical protein
MKKKSNNRKTNKKGGALDHNMRCAANLEYIEGSCLSTDELKALALTYNKAVDSNKIKGDKIDLVHNKEFLLKELDNRFSKCKGDHLCWLKQKFIKETNEFNPDEFFKPYGTDGPIEWLSDKNIDELMDQMEKKFEDFLFVGAVPIDFYEINYLDTAKIDFTDIMKNGYAEKNDIMKEYNLKKFYYTNILLCNEINKFLNKNGFYELFDFKADVKKYTENQFKKILTDFDKQFVSPKYDSEFIKSVKSRFADLPNNFVGEIIKIITKKYPIKRIGLVPNLDEHWKGGSHWVSLFANLETGQIYFFDSYGYPPDKRIKDYVKLIADWKYKTDTGKKLDIKSTDFMNKNKKNELEEKYDIQYNQLRNQYKGSECGVYSINFIVRLLHGAKIDDILKKKIPDDTVNKCREIYFNNQDINSEEFKLDYDGKKTRIKKHAGYVCE